MQPSRNPILDRFYLVCSALLVGGAGVSAFFFAEVRHFNALWVISQPDLHRFPCRVAEGVQDATPVSSVRRVSMRLALCQLSL